MTRRKKKTINTTITSLLPKILPNNFYIKCPEHNINMLKTIEGTLDGLDIATFVCENILCSRQMIIYSDGADIINNIRKHYSITKDVSDLQKVALQ